MTNDALFVSVGVENPRTVNVGNGSWTIQPIDWTFTDVSDVEVYFDDVIVPSGFTVEIGRIVFSTAPANGVIVTILRNTPLDQPAPFEDPQRTTLGELEVSVDRVVRQLQEREEKLERVPILPPSSTPQSRVSTSIGYDENGEPISRNASQERDFIGVGPEVERAEEAANRAESAVQTLPSLVPAASFNFTSQISGFNF